MIARRRSGYCAKDRVEREEKYCPSKDFTGDAHL